MPDDLSTCTHTSSLSCAEIVPSLWPNLARSKLANSSANSLPQQYEEDTLIVVQAVKYCEHFLPCLHLLLPRVINPCTCCVFEFSLNVSLHWSTLARSERECSLLGILKQENVLYYAFSNTDDTHSESLAASFLTGERDHNIYCVSCNKCLSCKSAIPDDFSRAEICTTWRSWVFLTHLLLKWIWDKVRQTPEFFKASMDLKKCKSEHCPVVRICIPVCIWFIIDQLYMLSIAHTLVWHDSHRTACVYVTATSQTHFARIRVLERLSCTIHIRLHVYVTATSRTHFARIRMLEQWPRRQ